ncbi:MAG TPA: cytidine deaminase [Bacteroidales bacterium]|nr:cytidine deaminase [Bacteroidales bacterium]
MKQHKINISFKEFDSQANFSAEEKKTIDAAHKSLKKAYAPYSHFHVGAAVLLENGKIITGNNQENAAFPSGLCAERVALFSANAQYPDMPVKLLVVVAGQKDILTYEPASPCGSCRQVMLETEIRFKHAIKIILVGQSKIYVLDSVKDLLPLSFDPDLLDQ